MIMEIISIILGVVLVGTYGYGEINLRRLEFLVDMPSLVLMLIFTVPVLLRGGVWKDFKRAWRLLRKNYRCHLSEVRRALDVVEMMQKQVLYAGVVCLLLTLILILGMLSDPATLGPNLAVAILTMLYAMIFEMLLLPLQLEAKRRIIDYMEVDTDAEMAAEYLGAGSFKEAAGREIENGKDLARKENKTRGEETEGGQI